MSSLGFFGFEFMEGYLFWWHRNTKTENGKAV